MCLLNRFRMAPHVMAPHRFGWGKAKLRFVFLPSLDDDAVAISEMMKSIEFPPPLDDMQLSLVLHWTGNLRVSFTAHWWMYLLLMVWSHSSMFFHCSMMMQLHPLVQYNLGYIHIIYIHFNWIYWNYFIHILQMYIQCVFGSNVL